MKNVKTERNAVKSLVNAFVQKEFLEDYARLDVQMDFTVKIAIKSVNVKEVIRVIKF